MREDTVTYAILRGVDGRPNRAMGRLTIELPTSLHVRLRQLAEREGVSLDQYVLYVLTREATQGYLIEEVPAEQVEKQRQDFDALLQELGSATKEEVAAVLAERDPVR